MKDCIFCKIANKKIPKEFTYEDSNVMVFADIHPLKPIHLLVVPKKHIVDVLDLSDMKLAGKLMVVLQKMIQDHKLDGKGYKIIVNGGGAQVIDHLHIHLLGPVGKEVGL